MGGGSSGGGSSGRSDWPDYMKSIHETWLNEMNSLIPSSNPYTGAAPYDPDSDLSSIDSVLSPYIDLNVWFGSDNADVKGTWEDWFDLLGNTGVLLSYEGFLTQATDKLSESVTATLDSEVVSRFEGGMRDINAVQTSQFVVGKALLYARVGNEIARIGGEAILRTIDARNKLLVEGPWHGLDAMLKVIEARRLAVQTFMDNVKIKITAKVEEAIKAVEYDVEAAKWPFFEYQHAGNLLAAISGGAVSQPIRPSPIQSAVGGVLTGAATGAMIGSAIGGASGGPVPALVGAGIGGAIGLIGGLFS